MFDVGKIDLEKTTEESIVAAYSRIFKIIEEYYFYPSKIESWNVIIETCDIGAFTLPIKVSYVIKADLYDKYLCLFDISRF